METRVQAAPACSGIAAPAFRSASLQHDAGLGRAALHGIGGLLPAQRNIGWRGRLARQRAGAGGWQLRCEARAHTPQPSLSCQCQTRSARRLPPCGLAHFQRSAPGSAWPEVPGASPRAGTLPSSLAWLPRASGAAASGAGGGGGAFEGSRDLKACMPNPGHPRAGTPPPRSAPTLLCSLALAAAGGALRPIPRGGRTSRQWCPAVDGAQRGCVEEKETPARVLRRRPPPERTCCAASPASLSASPAEVTATASGSSPYLQPTSRCVWGGR